MQPVGLQISTHSTSENSFDNQDVLLNFIEDLISIDGSKNTSIKYLEKIISNNHLDVEKSCDNIKSLMKNCKEQLQDALKNVRSARFSVYDIDTGTIEKLLKMMPNLVKLEMEYCDIKSIDLSIVPNLESLDIFSCSNIKHLDLSPLSNLRYLAIRLCFSLSSLMGVSNLSHCQIDCEGNSFIGSDIIQIIKSEMGATCQLGPASKKQQIIDIATFSSLQHK